ncbi:hypothetical protein F7308_0933 [Francisella salina]|uniref:Uncharacterized protein n=1 Tax=Francisella salina TaxID=573569 RepID=A0ABM5M9I0_FRAST|nr:hypothetical protein F7308_0933 [Francisella salina]
MDIELIIFIVSNDNVKYFFENSAYTKACADILPVQPV